MYARGWYVASIIGERIIDGPFEFRDDAIRRCIMLSSEQTIVKAVSSKSVVLHYYARFERGSHRNKTAI